jgi:glycosyltransferase involved in cell wall biosynthesis
MAQSFRQENCSRANWENKKTPLISVIVPLHNAAEYISRSIGSVLTQTYPHFELIVVDDGSTDGGGDIAENPKDSRIRLIRQNNLGVSAARNLGITEARGEYIAFLDADDKWDPIFLEVIVGLVDSYPEAGLYSTGFRMVYSKGADVEVTMRDSHNETDQLVHDYFWKAADDAFIHTSGVVIPHYVFAEIGMFTVGVKHGEDLEMWARIALHYPIAYDSRVLFCFYQSGPSGKPRFSVPLKTDPVLALLRKHVVKSNNSATERAIKHYMLRYSRSTCWSFVRMKNRNATADYINNNNIRLHGISASMIKSLPFLWYGLQLFSFLRTIRHSRIMLRILGGERKSREIIQRLVVS